MKEEITHVWVDEHADNARDVAEKLADSADVLVVGGRRSGYVGYGAIGAALSMAITASSMGFGLHAHGMNKLFRPEKEKTKCLNKPCEEYTSHNSGYCSKACKVENQKRFK